MKPKQIFAILGIVLLLALYALTFAAALTSSPASTGLFMASVFCTVFIPLCTYILLWMFRTFGSKKYGGPSEEERIHPENGEEPLTDEELAEEALSAPHPVTPMKGRGQKQPKQ